ncbi:MAG: radical SAM family heme chaperone HemW [Deltaproteobacteria bacterium]|nr:radical SAM family heme chaperone HemW [Deltaproteobacteria bacterium]
MPFCQTKCPYCDFYSITSPELIPAYLEALEREAQLYKDTFHAFDSLYLGGGTPSLLNGPQLCALVESLRRPFDFAPDTEFTLEVNPDDVTPEKLRLWRDLGINRLSLGVQSFDEPELRFLKRRHTARQTIRALEQIRTAGFRNLGLDLMYGLPGQSLKRWTETMKTALSFAPEHLSCYQLTIAAGETPAPPSETPALPTPFARLAARGELTLPDDEAQRDFFLLTGQFLRDHGYVHYEVSNFAKGERYCCRHNLKYWSHTPYLGLGPAAHSSMAGRRWWNHCSLQSYTATLAKGELPVAGSETLTPEQLRLEALCLGFRTREGVALEIIRQFPGWEAVLSELQGSGLLQLTAGRVAATPEGLVVADRLPLLFVD